MGLLRYRSPSGEPRPWTVKEAIQGRPINRPTHPMLVFFPIASFVGTLAFDVLSRLGLTGGARGDIGGRMVFEMGYRVGEGANGGPAGREPVAGEERTLAP